MDLLLGYSKKKLGLKQLINSATTDYNTCLDHIYPNLPTRQVKRFGTLESYYSDHKPNFIVLAWVECFTSGINVVQQV